MFDWDWNKGSKFMVFWLMQQNAKIIYTHTIEYFGIKKIYFSGTKRLNLKVLLQWSSLNEGG